MTVSNFFRGTLLALGTLASSAIMAQAGPGSGETVRIQKYPGATSLLAMVAVDKGYCSKYGINCVLVNNPSSVVSLQALLSGGLDVATPGVETAVQLAVKGTPVRMIGNAVRTSPYMLAMGGQKPDASQKKSYPALMHDLKGKKIGVTTRGSGPEYVLTTLLLDAGMKKSDVTIVAVGGPDTSYAALVNKQIDAVVSFEPLGALCEVLNTCHVGVWLSRGEGPKELTALNGAYAPLVVRADYAEKNPKVIKALRSAFKDAETFIQTSANFDALTSIVKKDFKLDNPQSDEVITAMVRNALPFFYSELDTKSLQAASDYMLRTGQLDKAYNTSGVVLP